jgi:hypothetical protein
MKRYSASIFVLLVLLSISLPSQQISIHAGANFQMKGYNNENLDLSDRGKEMVGIQFNNLYRNFGLYGSWYSSRKVVYGDFVIRHQPDFTGPIDSIVTDSYYMPLGFSAGITYNFSPRFSVYVGAGLSKFRVKHSVANNLYMPTSTGWYNYLHESNMSETFYVCRKQVAWELGADYDLITNEGWRLGPRLGYNSSQGLTAELFLGYCFVELESR